MAYSSVPCSKPPPCGPPPLPYAVNGLSLATTHAHHDMMHHPAMGYAGKLFRFTRHFYK